MRNIKIDPVLAVICLFSVLVRIPSITDGLPATYNSTEYFLAKTALYLGAQSTLDPGIYIYPSLYIYVLFFLYGLLYTAGTIFGIFPDLTAFAVTFLIQPDVFYLTGRLFSLLLFVMQILIIYKFLRENYDTLTARTGAALTAFSVLVLQYSATATSDMMMLFFCTLSIVTLFNPKRKFKAGTYLFAGLFSGLAVACKYNAGFLVPAVLIGCWFSAKENNIASGSAMGLAAAGAAGAFLLTNPLWLVYPDRYWQGFTIISSQMYQALSYERGIPYLWEISTLLRTELVAGFLFLVATVVLFWKDYKKMPAQVFFIATTFLFVGSWQKKGLDYLLPIFPLLIIYAARYLVAVYNSLKKASIRMALLGIVFVPSIIMQVFLSWQKNNPDTREQMTSWLINNASEGTVCYDNSHMDLGVFDVDRYIEYGAGAGQLPEQVRNEVEKYRDHERQLQMKPVLKPVEKAKPLNRRTFETDKARFQRKSLRELQAEGVDYFISNSRHKEIYFTADEDEYPEVIRNQIRRTKQFYKTLDAEYKPLKTFTPNNINPGPELRIFKILHE